MTRGGLARGDVVRWALLGLLLVAQLLPKTGVNPAVAAIVGELPVVIALLHFAAWTRWRTALTGLAVMYAVGYLSEFIGTHTGLVFGRYVYSPTDIGPLLWQVPILLPLAYFSMGYCSYVVTRVMLRNIHRRLSGAELVLTSVLAAFVMTAIDISTDPILATVLGNWTWEDGGAYFGVPVHNFYGWLATTLVFFLLVGWLLNRRANVAALQVPRPAQFPAQAIVLYASYGLGVILNPLLGRTGEIYDAMSMIALFTMTVPVLAAAAALRPVRSSPARPAG